MPTVWRQPLVRGEDSGERLAAYIDRDERAFQRAYVEDHSREFRKALRTARVAFLVRMAAI